MNHVAALAFLSSVFAAYCADPAGALPAFAASALLVPLLCGGKKPRGIALLPVQIALIAGASLRLASLAASVCAKHGEAAAFAVTVICAALALRLALTHESALYSASPVTVLALALLPLAAAVSGGENPPFAVTDPGSEALAVALFCPVSAGLALRINSNRGPCGVSKGLAPGAAALAAVTLFPSGESVFAFICVPLCVIQLSLELRALLAPFRENTKNARDGIELTG